MVTVGICCVDALLVKHYVELGRLVRAALFEDVSNVIVSQLVRSSLKSKTVRVAANSACNSINARSLIPVCVWESSSS